MRDVAARVHCPRSGRPGLDTYLAQHVQNALGAIMRRDFGITFGLAADSKMVIGDKVDITLDVQAVLEA